VILQPEGKTSGFFAGIDKRKKKRVEENIREKKIVSEKKYF